MPINVLFKIKNVDINITRNMIVYKIKVNMF